MDMLYRLHSLQSPWTGISSLNAVSYLEHLSFYYEWGAYLSAGDAVEIFSTSLTE